ncbi:LysR family transcriptional regulator [Paraburkholderia franconis]|uniref:LysR family transcriptional regulator n=1 Tax=Paraburkholderia franconis TaxID=2654983 RepID=UPI0038990C4B
MRRPSASERISNIESDAGVVLLERSRNGVVTTEAGEALAHLARLILRQHSLLQENCATLAPVREVRCRFPGRKSPCRRALISCLSQRHYPPAFTVAEICCPRIPATRSRTLMAA